MSLTRRPLSAFLAELASTRPTPGGGSAAALAAASGVALYAKVCRMLLARPALGDRRRAVRRARTVCDRAARVLQRLIDEDAEAYGRLVRLRRQPASPRPAAALHRAQADAVRVPMAICEQAIIVWRLTPWLKRAAGRLLASDVAAGAALIEAGVSGAMDLAAVNATGMRDPRALRAAARQFRRWARAIPRVHGKMIP